MAIKQKYNPISGQFDFVGAAAADEPFVLVDGSYNPSALDGSGQVQVTSANPTSIGFNGETPSKGNSVFVKNIDVYDTGVVNHNATGGLAVKIRQLGAGSNAEEYLYPSSDAWGISSFGTGDYSKSYIELANNYVVMGHNSGDGYNIISNDSLGSKTFAIREGLSEIFKIDTLNDAFFVDKEIRYNSTPTLPTSLNFTHKGYVDVLAGETATATSSSAAHTIQTLSIASGDKVAFTVYATGHDTVTDDKAYYTVEGLIENDGGTTALVDAVTVTKVSESGTVDALTVTVTADDAANTLDVDVTQNTNSTNWSSKITYITL
jgi:hypothetical protein